jgi:hypothetical protein
MYAYGEARTFSGNKLRVSEEIVLNETFGPVEDGAGVYELCNHE